jgi:hypothetical protein
MPRSRVGFAERSPMSHRPVSLGFFGLAERRRSSTRWASVPGGRWRRGVGGGQAGKLTAYSQAIVKVREAWSLPYNSSVS